MKSDKKMWRSPVCQDAKFGNTPPAGFQLHLSEQVKGYGVNRDYEQSRKQFPTPTTQETEHPQAELTETGRRKTATGDSHSLNLADTVRLTQGHEHSFPTPGTTGFSNGSGNCEKANTLAKEGVLTEEERVSFRAGNGGQLNPDWTEWLMDWPIGWTDLKPMSKENMDDWLYRISNCQWNEHDPAELPKNHELYVPRLTEDKTHRADRLKAIGNGQVPLCVFFATKILTEVLFNELHSTT